MRRCVLAVLAVLCVAACGVSLEDRPQRFDDTSVQEPSPTPSVETSRPTTTPTTTTPPPTTGS